ncbi:MAG TPA: hypothetical protein VEO95_06440, partial [Chthoniobacteraceae bacterium]|nr:hypothetical protein [Chthoniobacteraceae bacterium]
ESDRTGGSADARGALTQLETLLRDGYNAIYGIPSFKITDSQRIEVLTAYGWVNGKLGSFNDARVLGLARLAVRDNPGVDPQWQYGAELVQALKAQLAIYDDSAKVATGADRVQATRVRDDALATLETTLARVRFYYCCASEDADQTTELTRIGLQPRRAPGAAQQPAPPPAPPAQPPAAAGR